MYFSHNLLKGTTVKRISHTNVDSIYDCLKWTFIKSQMFKEFKKIKKSSLFKLLLSIGNIKTGQFNTILGYIWNSVALWNVKIKEQFKIKNTILFVYHIFNDPLTSKMLFLVFHLFWACIKVDLLISLMITIFTETIVSGNERRVARRTLGQASRRGLTDLTTPPLSNSTPSHTTMGGDNTDWTAWAPDVTNCHCRRWGMYFALVKQK